MNKRDPQVVGAVYDAVVWAVSGAVGNAVDGGVDGNKLVLWTVGNALSLVETRQLEDFVSDWTLQSAPDHAALREFLREASAQRKPL